MASLPALSLCLCLAAMLPHAALAAASIEQLDWLAGCWVAEGAEEGSGERWTEPAGGTMLGVSRTVRGGRTVAFEYLRIQEAEGGALEYVALPSGQAEATFTLSAAGERDVAFENPDHDFPQRVSYRLVDGERLEARIDGVVDGRPRAVDFAFRRVACDPDDAAAGPAPEAGPQAEGEPEPPRSEPPADPGE